MSKILFLGEIGPGQTSLMRMRAMGRLGHRMRGIHTVEPWIRASWLKRQVQRRLRRGSIVAEINDSVLATAREFRPEVVWAEKQEYVHRSTLDELRGLGARLIHFTPDPYFSLEWKRTPVMDEAMKDFDVLVYCKAYEKASYEATGRQAIYMPLGYCDEVHRPVHSDFGRWNAEAGFLGGWEPRRERLLRRLAQAGIEVKFWGGHWGFLLDGRWTLRRHIILRQLAGDEPFAIRQDALLAAAYQGNEVYGSDYARALSGCRIGLGFLRKICPDQHTTRTFEIPACGSMLLADRTEEHREMFTEDREAVFFEGDDELVEKARFYASNQAARERIAAAGLARCESGGYSYVRRLGEVLRKLGINQE